MSRILKLIFIVPEEAVGGVIADMEGRHRGLAIEVSQLVDKRDKPKAKGGGVKKWPAPSAVKNMGVRALERLTHYIAEYRGIQPQVVSKESLKQNRLWALKELKIVKQMGEE